MLKSILFLLFIAGYTYSATIAIVDSGTDYLHRDLSAKMLVSQTDKVDGVDNDNNGFIDDIHGWNFAENNYHVIDEKYYGTFSKNAYKFFDIQGKMFEKKAHPKEIEWMNKKRQDKLFLKELQTFGNFIHGTHVAGITVADGDENSVMAVKIIPTKVLPFVFPKSFESAFVDLKEKILMAALNKLSSLQSQMFAQVGKYINDKKIDVANGSFGTGPVQAKMIVGAAFKAVYFRDAKDDELKKFIKYFLERSVFNAKILVDSAPNTLWVFAAGNDANDNDVTPTSPACISAGNSITVAATHERNALASFSSFGKKSVHVAAPGVNINSTIPDNEYLKLSGTSQAAPAVAGLAAKIKSSNPELMPSEIKRIIMGTVDKKSYLNNKTYTGGIINNERALVAARHSMTWALAKSIQMSIDEVKDVETNSWPLNFDNSKEMPEVLPLPSSFYIQ